MSNNKLKGQSVTYLEKYWTRKEVSQKQKDFVARLIAEKRIEIKREAEKYISSPLFCLACVETVRKGRTRKQFIDGQEMYVPDLTDVLVTMKTVVDNATKNGKLEILKEYCKEV